MVDVLPIRRLSLTNWPNPAMRILKRKALVFLEAQQSKRLISPDASFFLNTDKNSVISHITRKLHFVLSGYCAEGENYCTNGECIIRSGKRVCLCLPGYTLTSKTVCEDFDECALQGEVQHTYSTSAI